MRSSRLTTLEMGAYRTSMQIDREMGRPLEVEAILGEPARLAEARGVKTPYLRMIYLTAAMVASELIMQTKPAA